MKIARMAFDRLLLIQQYGISSSLFKSMLDLMPPDTTFIGCGFDGMQNIDYMFFTSDQFVDTPQAMTVPDIYCNFRTHTNGSVKTVVAESIDFGKAMPNTKNIMVNGHPSTFTLPSAVGTCNHFWVTHQGLRDSYDYCKMCNVRKNP